MHLCLVFTILERLCALLCVLLLINNCLVYVGAYRHMIGWRLLTYFFVQIGSSLLTLVCTWIDYNSAIKNCGMVYHLNGYFM